MDAWRANRPRRARQCSASRKGPQRRGPGGADAPVAARGPCCDDQRRGRDEPARHHPGRDVADCARAGAGCRAVDHASTGPGGRGQVKLGRMPLPAMSDQGVAMARGGRETEGAGAIRGLRGGRRGGRFQVTQLDELARPRRAIRIGDAADDRIRLPRRGQEQPVRAGRGRQRQRDERQGARPAQCRVGHGFASNPRRYS